MQMIYVICRDGKEAERIADALVGEKLVACANIIPKIKSVYRWKGKIARETECLLLCKTTTERAGIAMRKIKEMHSYEVPCIVSYEACNADPEYNAWVHKEVKK